MLVKLFAENPYTFAALLAMAWVLVIMMPCWIYVKSSPANRLKRFPRQDNPKGNHHV